MFFGKVINLFFLLLMINAYSYAADPQQSAELLQSHIETNHQLLEQKPCRVASGEVDSLKKENAYLLSLPGKIISSIFMNYHQDLSERLVAEAQGWRIFDPTSTLNGIASKELSSITKTLEDIFGNNQQVIYTQLKVYYDWQRSLLAEWFKEHPQKIGEKSPVFYALFALVDDAAYRGVQLENDYLEKFYKAIDQLEFYKGMEKTIIKYLERLNAKPAVVRSDGAADNSGPANTKNTPYVCPPLSTAGRSAPPPPPQMAPPPPATARIRATLHVKRSSVPSNESKELAAKEPKGENPSLGVKLPGNLTVETVTKSRRNLKPTPDKSIDPDRFKSPQQIALEEAHAKIMARYKPLHEDSDEETTSGSEGW